MPTLSPAPQQYNVERMLVDVWLPSAKNWSAQHCMSGMWGGRNHWLYIFWTDSINYTFLGTGVLGIKYRLKNNEPGCENASTVNLSKTMGSACGLTVLANFFAAPIFIQSGIIFLAARTSMSSKIRGHMWRRSHASTTRGTEKRKDFGIRMHGVWKSIWLPFAVASRSAGDTAYNAEAGESIAALRFILLDPWLPLDLEAMCNDAFSVKFSTEGTKSNRTLLYGCVWMCCYFICFCGRRLKTLIFYMYFCGRRWRRHSFAWVFVEDAGVYKRIYPISYSYFLQRLPQNHNGFSVFFSVFHKNTWKWCVFLNVFHRNTCAWHVYVDIRKTRLG